MAASPPKERRGARVVSLVPADVASWARPLARAPLATAAGALLGLCGVGAYWLLVPSCRLDTHLCVRHPLVPFVLAALLPIAGAWIDWARLARASRRTAAWSAVALAAAVSLSFEVALLEDVRLALVAGPALFGAAALAALVAGGVLDRTLAHGGFGLALASGCVRRVEDDAIAVETCDGTLEVGARELRLPVGSPIVVVGSFVACPSPADAAPYRAIVTGPRRGRARFVLGAARSLPELRGAWRRRARSWSAYFLVLALGSGVASAALAHGPRAPIAAAQSAVPPPS